MFERAREVAPGDRLGHYHIERPLGQGGMGLVYLAHDTVLDREVAVKLLTLRHVSGDETSKRFLREARAAARLSHPNIVPIHGIDMDHRPPYIVMGFVDGASLDRSISRSHPLPWQRALQICGYVASALAAAHAQGIIHRDIKPGNILLDAQGRVHVTDFGIAKVLDAQTRLTAEQVSIGSPAYMSPEQCGAGEVTPQSDLFALGVTTYEMMTGRLPFVAETSLGLIKKITSAPLPDVRESIPDAPPIVQTFLESLTAKRPEQRYPDARAVMEDLHALLNNQPPQHLARLHGQQVAVEVSPAAQACAVAKRKLVDDILEHEENVFTQAPPPPSREIPWLPIGLVALLAISGAALAYAWTQGYFRAPGPRAEPGPPPATASAPGEALPQGPPQGPPPGAAEAQPGPPPGQSGPLPAPRQLPDGRLVYPGEPGYGPPPPGAPPPMVRGGDGQLRPPPRGPDGRPLPPRRQP